MLLLTIALGLLELLAVLGGWAFIAVISWPGGPSKFLATVGILWTLTCLGIALAFFLALGA